MSAWDFNVDADQSWHILFGVMIGPRRELTTYDALSKAIRAYNAVPEVPGGETASTPLAQTVKSAPSARGTSVADLALGRRNRWRTDL